MHYLPTIKQLQYLVALADTGSFSDAAVQCRVTQSTLSAGIATLEDGLGHPVVDRSQRRMVLTPFGQTVLEKARRIISEATDILDHAMALNAKLSGPLRLGIIPTIAPYVLPHLLPALQERFPDLDLQIREDLSERLVESLRQHRIDLALMAFPYECPDMHQEILFGEAFVLAAPKNRWHKKTVSNDDLKGREIMLLEEGHCLRDHALEACLLNTAQTRNTFSATSLPTLMQMVEHGYGLTLLPEMAIKWGQGAHNIDTFEFRSPKPQRQIGMAWRKNSPRSEEFMLFAEATSEILHLKKDKKAAI